ncbi:MAG: elongation factor Ts [Deltaproteobacteria bacterium]|nr:elongation factor Ts [Gammaproteobacteria bacterium]MBT8372227.1 elongation factor Ts [Deltaproteobacteria bacterium]NNC97830.1 elongation factor Ts [Gammaproteobacteria bacterium]NNM13703.1 elongation factor Ts [Gammaproteobacteria bacterium]
MAITAAMVKELRERTGSGMMECKKALKEVGGDMELAVEHLRKTGLAKADKKASNVAAEGLIGYAASADGKTAALVEVNCQTDFVSGGEEFGGLTKKVTDAVLANRPASVEELLAIEVDGESLETTRRALIAKIGENMNVRRFEILESNDRIAHYAHGKRISVLVAVEGGDDEVARDVAMHIAASRPQFISADDVPAEVLNKEREILIEQAKGEGKPENIVEKMVEGRVRKFLAEITLDGQAFVKDPDTTVGKLLSQNSAKVTGFVRYEVGEGIEKKEENFADEVMAQVRAS